MTINWKQENRQRRDGTIDGSEDGRTNFRRDNAPAWTRTVPPLGKKFNLVFSAGFDEPQCSIKLDGHFLFRNIEDSMAFIYSA